MTYSIIWVFCILFAIIIGVGTGYEIANALNKPTEHNTVYLRQGDTLCVLEGWTQSQDFIWVNVSLNRSDINKSIELITVRWVKEGGE